MMKKSFLIPLAVGVVLIMGCKNKKDEQLVIPPAPPINFEKLEVGQKSRYILFQGKNYLSSIPIFEYVYDTMMIEITGKDENGFIVKEYATPASIGDVDASQPDSTYFYYFNIVNDTLIITHNDDRFVLQSRIFPYENVQKYPLRVARDSSFHFTGWRADPLCLSCTGTLESFELFGKQFDPLEVIVNNNRTVTDGLGFTWVFSKKEGFVRGAYFSPFNNKGHGWDLLSD